MVSDSELEKVKNKTESMMAFEDMAVMNRATSLAMYELLGDANLINNELDIYRSISSEELMQVANQIFTVENSNTLRYLANQN